MTPDPDFMRWVREARQKPVEELYPHDAGITCGACFCCAYCGRNYHGGLCPCNSPDPWLAGVPNQQFGRVRMTYTCPACLCAWIGPAVPAVCPECENRLGVLAGAPAASTATRPEEQP